MKSVCFAVFSLLLVGCQSPTGPSPAPVPPPNSLHPIARIVPDTVTMQAGDIQQFVVRGPQDFDYNFHISFNELGGFDTESNKYFDLKKKRAQIR